MGNPDEWNRTASIGVRYDLQSLPTGGLKLTYVIPGFGGWIAFERPVEWRLATDALVRVDVEGAGRGTFEVKLFPSSGGIQAVLTPVGTLPRPLDCRRADFKPLGAGTAAALDEVRMLGFAVSSDTWCEGEIVIHSVKAVAGITAGIEPFEAYDVDGASDEELLDEIERRTVAYFWETADPTHGVAIDHQANGTDENLGKVAATGFGLVAVCIGVERGWIPRQDGYDRILRTLRLFENDHGPDGWVRTGEAGRTRAEGRWGLWFHYVNRKTGRWDGSDCVAICDSSDLVAALLVCRSYFAGTEIAALATRILDNIQWPKFLLRRDEEGRRLFSWGYLPKGGSSWYPGDAGDRLVGKAWGLADNSLLFYFLAMGSRTHPIPVETWRDYVSTMKPGEYGGYHCFEAPQSFCRQVPLGFMGLRGWKSQGVDFFADLANATMAQRQYGIDTGHYDAHLWGFDDCLPAPGGPYTHGGPPGKVTDDGTIATAGFAASAPFVPGPVMAAVRSSIERYGTRIFGPYGFTSSLNPDKSFFSPHVVGIEAGPILIALENMRTGFVWRHFMADTVARTAMSRIGFEPVIDDFELPPEASQYAAWSAEGGTIEVAKGLSSSGHHHLRVVHAGGGMRLRARPFALDRSGFGRLALDARGCEVTAVTVTGTDGSRMELRRNASSGSPPGWNTRSWELGPTRTGLAEIEFQLAVLGSDAAIDNVTLMR